MSPIIPDGPLAGVEFHRVKTIRSDDDPIALRVSMGGNDESGYYINFRGDPAKVREMIAMLAEAAEKAVVDGHYADMRNGGT